jgi:hypothetical protein
MVHPESPPSNTTSAAILRLSDPAHSARKQIRQVVDILDSCIEVVVQEDRTATRATLSHSELEKALSALGEAITCCPNDFDLLVAKAFVLEAGAQFKSAEEVLDLVLSKDPSHFEARMWKSHWNEWTSPIRFPAWDERQTILHPVMKAHLALRHQVQIVRDGLQKAVAIVAAVQGPPFDSRTQVETQWILSETPFGPLVAYYMRIAEPSGEPSTMEAFLPMFKPSLFSPQEGWFLVQQLAWTPYCFAVLADEDAIALNRRLTFREKAVHTIREMAQKLARAESFLPQEKFQAAMQWHMANFDMNRLRFD